MTTDLAAPPSGSLAQRLGHVQATIAKAARRVGRAPAEIALVAVSKTHDAGAVAAAIAAGQWRFGENRVQEAEAKFPALKQAHQALDLHLIGPLQTNKVKDACALFDVIQTLDRERLARALADQGARSGRLPRLYVQVNTGEEPQKAGCLPRDTGRFLTLCRTDYGLAVEGLMCIPPVDQEPALHFALLRQLARDNGLAGLSMGMSHDYERAVEFGATLVRVGTAIFGRRA